MSGKFRRANMIAAVLILLIAPIAQARTTPKVAENAQLAIDRDFPDPDIFETESAYYAFGTNTGGSHVQAATATDPAGPWQALPDALPAPPGWIGPDEKGSMNIWAPDVSQRSDGSFLLYYTAFHAQSRKQCLGAAVSDNPAGPFTPTSQEPLICEPAKGDIIDPASFVDGDGSRYLLYKDAHGARARSGPSTIRLRPVAEDGLTPTGRDVALLRADRPEEAGVVEAPTLVRRPEGYVLFFSANTFDSGSYHSSYATAPSVNGPFTKAPGPFLSQEALSGSVVNPGGQDVLEDRVVFHGDLGTGNGHRGMYVAGMGWNGLNPVLGDPESAKRERLN